VFFKSVPLNSTPARNFTRLAVAIVIAAVVISASALSYSSFEATVTRTNTGATTSSLVGGSTMTTTLLSTTTVTSTTTATMGSTVSTTIVSTLSKTVTSTVSTTLVSTITATVVSSASVSTGSSPFPEEVYLSGVSPDGLQLAVLVNSSTVQRGGAVSVQMAVLNTLDSNVSPQVVTNQNISSWNGYDFLCGLNPSDSLVGFAVFAGHWSAGNVSAAGDPLQLMASVSTECALTRYPNGVTFLPASDRATYYCDHPEDAECPYSSTSAVEVNASTGYCVPVPYQVNNQNFTGYGCGTQSDALFGYWDTSQHLSPQNATLASGSFVYFPRGEYTIVATDDWNQSAYAYFTVA